jgi:hypothetical protein
MLLQGAGMFQVAQACHVTMGDLRLYAEIRGTSQVEAPSTLMTVTPQLKIMSDSELDALKDVLHTDKLNELLSRVSDHKSEANIADLVSLHPISTSRTISTNWTTSLLIATSGSLLAVVIYYCARQHWVTLVKCCTKKESHGLVLDTPPTGSSPPILPTSELPVAEERSSTSNARSDFAVYAMHQNN